jgi:hypothetical protein
MAELEHPLTVERGLRLRARPAVWTTTRRRRPSDRRRDVAQASLTHRRRPRSRLVELLAGPIRRRTWSRGFEAATERWHALLPELTERVAQANRLYDDLLDRIAPQRR